MQTDSITTELYACLRLGLGREGYYVVRNVRYEWPKIALLLTCRGQYRHITSTARLAAGKQRAVRQLTSRTQCSCWIYTDQHTFIYPQAHIKPTYSSSQNMELGRFKIYLGRWRYGQCAKCSKTCIFDNFPNFCYRLRYSPYCLGDCVTQRLWASKNYAVQMVNTKSPGLRRTSMPSTSFIHSAV